MDWGHAWDMIWILFLLFVGGVCGYSLGKQAGAYDAVREIKDRKMLKKKYTKRDDDWA